MSGDRIQYSWKTCIQPTCIFFLFIYNIILDSICRPHQEILMYWILLNFYNLSLTTYHISRSKEFLKTTESLICSHEVLHVSNIKKRQGHAINKHKRSIQLDRAQRKSVFVKRKSPINHIFQGNYVFGRVCLYIFYVLSNITQTVINGFWWYSLVYLTMKRDNQLNEINQIAILTVNLKLWSVLNNSWADLDAIFSG